MTVQELNTLHTVSELERNQLLTILAKSVQNPELAVFLLTGNLSNFLYVESSTAWIDDCPPFFSRLYKADRYFDRILLHFEDTLMYVDPITKQTYDYATPFTCDNVPRNSIELDLHSDDQEFYILGPEPIKRKPPFMFTPSQVKTTIPPNVFTAQDAGIYSNAELDQFWNIMLFSKHSDSTLQLLGKAHRYSVVSSNTPDYDANFPHHNPYNTFRIGLHDRLIDLTPLFTTTWFFSNSDDQTNHITTPTCITSPPTFYTKRPNKSNEKARIKLVSKRKQSLHPKTNHEILTLHSSIVQIPALPNYSNVCQ